MIRDIKVQNCEVANVQSTSGIAKTKRKKYDDGNLTVHNDFEPTPMIMSF